MKDRKLHVAVFFGGEAGSHDLSQESGEWLCYFLPREKYRVTPVRVTPEGAWQVPLGHLPQRGPIKRMLTNLFQAVAPVPPKQGLERLLLRPVQALITLLRGRGGDDGALHGLAQTLGIVTVGSGLPACQQTSDKHACALRLADIVTPPEARRYQPGEALEDIISDVRDFMVPPLFVKPAAQEASVGIREALSLEELSGALREAQSFGDVLIQPRSVGQEVSLTLFDDARGRVQALPATVIVPERARFFDHLAKRRPGRVQLFTRADESETVLEAEAIAREVYRELGCRGPVSFDMVAEADGSLTLLDVNVVPTLSTLTPLLAQLRVGGVAPGALYDTLIQRSLGG